MKRSFVLGILGLATAAVTSYGQGVIWLDNYQSSGPQVYFGSPLGGGLLPAGFTAGLYYDPTPNENIIGSIALDPLGWAIPTSLNPALVLATGLGSTAPFIGYGYFTAGAPFLIQPDPATPPQSSYTIMLVWYNGADYASSTIRGHSYPVYIQDTDPSEPLGADIGNFFPSGFIVYPIPEPTTLALTGLGCLALWLMRRKKT